MSEFIRLPSVVLNVAHVVSVVRGPESVVVLLAVSEGITCGDQGKVAPIRLHFTGEEGMAIMAYFEGVATDVLAMHGKGQAAQGAMCPSCGEVPVTVEGRWCQGCAADFEARR